MCMNYVKKHMDVLHKPSVHVDKKKESVVCSKTSYSLYEWILENDYELQENEKVEDNYDTQACS